MEENSDLFGNNNDSCDNENSGNYVDRMNVEMPTKGSEMKEISRLTMKTDLLMFDAGFVATSALSSTDNHRFNVECINKKKLKIRPTKKVDLPLFVWNVMYHRILQHEQIIHQKKRKATESQLEKKFETYLALRKRILRYFNLNDTPTTIIGFRAEEVNKVLELALNTKIRSVCNTFIEKLASNDEYKDETKGFKTEDAYFEVLLPLIDNESNLQESVKQTKQFPKTKGDRILPIWLLPELCDQYTTKEFKECFPSWAIASHCLTLLTRKLMDENDAKMKNALNTAIERLMNVQQRLTNDMKEKIRDNERKANKLNDLANGVDAIRQRVLMLNKLNEYEWRFGDLCNNLDSKVKQLNPRASISPILAKLNGKAQRRRMSEQNELFSQRYVDNSNRENDINSECGDDDFGDIEIPSTPEQLIHMDAERNDAEPENVETKNKEVPAAMDSGSSNHTNNKADEDILDDSWEDDLGNIDLSTPNQEAIPQDHEEDDFGDKRLDKDEPTLENEENLLGDIDISTPQQEKLDDVLEDCENDMIGNIPLTPEKEMRGDLQPRTRSEPETGSLAKDKDSSNKESSNADSSDNLNNCPKEQLQSEISSPLNGQVSHSKKRSRESEDDSCANKKRRIEK